ncbi:hypothetical protein DFJ74DRAFT_72972 [Hyaloraphidium curvatum]|nr:hypothetical protein DFJ74DRAFT_72972 [Hyaloraphidium curvatum]
MPKIEPKSPDRAFLTPAEAPSDSPLLPPSAPRAGAGFDAAPASAPGGAASGSTDLPAASAGDNQAPSMMASQVQEREALPAPTVSSGVHAGPLGSDLASAGPVTGSVSTEAAKEDAARAHIVALKTEETAEVLRSEAKDVTQKVTEQLESVQRLLLDQQQLERDRYEELVKRQRQDLVALRERDLELSNEVEFLRARLERLTKERDRAVEAAQTAREAELEGKLVQREAQIEQQKKKIEALQDALQRIETRSEVRTTRAVRELQEKHDRELKELEAQWTIRLNENKTEADDHLAGLRDQFERLREENSSLRQQADQVRSTDAEAKSQINALQRALDKVHDENANLKDLSSFKPSVICKTSRPRASMIDGISKSWASCGPTSTSCSRLTASTLTSSTPKWRRSTSSNLGCARWWKDSSSPKLTPHVTANPRAPRMSRLQARRRRKPPGRRVWKPRPCWLRQRRRTLETLWLRKRRRRGSLDLRRRGIRAIV